ncbi:hypothetical protein V7x_21140 [Crateriforma conspicua]|uniref:Uncharacterized protein n=1 Tax=Crateriforma conspicua TaxID=2527996 RepID=A0A5C6FU50_9PLAN|nr:hypothetical protein V7x_21140 [Crateriforma conspicua]
MASLAPDLVFDFSIPDQCPQESNPTCDRVSISLSHRYQT